MRSQSWSDRSLFKYALTLAAAMSWAVLGTACDDAGEGESGSGGHDHHHEEHGEHGDHGDHGGEPTCTHMEFVPSVGAVLSSVNGTFRASVVSSTPAQHTSPGDNILVLDILDANGAAAVGASLLVAEPLTSAHGGHGSGTVPEVMVDAALPNRFTVTKLRYAHHGTWDMGMTVTAGAVTDNFTFELCIAKQPATGGTTTGDHGTGAHEGSGGGEHGDHTTGHDATGGGDHTGGHDATGSGGEHSGSHEAGHEGGHEAGASTSG